MIKITHLLARTEIHYLHFSLDQEPGPNSVHQYNLLSQEFEKVDTPGSSPFSFSDVPQVIWKQINLS